MMYGNKLAAAIKVNGKVLREFKDTVYVPYGQEYTILVKNLHTQRAVVNVYIDGENVVPGGLVLNAGQETDLERSIKNGNLNEGNRFKFIERTGNIEQHRGIKLEDGLVRIEYQFEQYVKPYIPPFDIYKVQGGIGGSSTWTCDANTRTKSTIRNMSMTGSGQMMNNMSSSISTSYNETGITVPGSKSEQKFQTTYVGMLEAEKHSMIIRLLGDLGNNKPVLEPVTVKHKPKCVTCGKQNKATAKFCTECGTALEIFA